MIVGFDTNDDAAVYRINDEQAIVQTVDFITPMFNDPFIFGQVAAANSLSDVYAMGGKPLTVLNLVCFDGCNFSKDVLKQILAGGLDKIRESGALLIGGHTIDDLEMKYGLSVTGMINPGKVLKNNTGKIGNKIILTKPLGAGILTTALKAEMITEPELKEAIFYMTMLNKTASEIALNFSITGMTDVTGFGLIGHLGEMVNDRTAIKLFSDKILLMQHTREMAEMGMIPGGSYRNRDYFKQIVDYTGFSQNEADDIYYYDTQTSGGLLIAVDDGDSANLISALHAAGLTASVVIGEIVERKTEHKIYLN